MCTMMKWKATPPPDFSNLDVIPKLLTQDLLSDDRRTVKIALTQLADLCILPSPTQASTNRRNVFAYGGHLLIVQVLKKWYQSAGIQRQGCRALQNAGSAGIESADFCDACVKVGAVETVLSAMANFEAVQDVQRCAIGALLNLSLRSEANTRRLVIALDGIRLIVSAMKKFPLSRDLNEWGAWTMDNASMWKDFQSVLIKNGCVMVLAAAMEEYDKDLRIQQFTRRTLTRLCEPLERSDLVAYPNGGEQSINKQGADIDQSSSSSSSGSSSSEAWESSLTISTVTTDGDVIVVDSKI